MSTYESRRLDTLRKLNILDTTPSEGFDRITRLASKLFGLPLAGVSLTDKDRQWFKSRVGTDICEVPRYRSPCSEVSASSQLLVIQDLLADDFYRESPQAQLGMRFYAGAPLTTREGYTLGTLCVLGTEPRIASQEEIDALIDLSHMVMAQIELQHALKRLDSVTMLPNRTYFADDLEDLKLDRPGDEGFAVFIELSSVLELNTTTRVMGESQVDALAREGARELRSKLDRGDILYSVGPCQYLFLQMMTDEAQLQRKARQLQRHLSRPSLWSNPASIVRPIIGLLPFTLSEGLQADELIRLAQSTCQSARQAEIPVATFTPALDAEQQRQYRLLDDIRRALRSGSKELSLVFQPRITLKSGECVGAEALLRWNHPELGPIPPTEFIPLIENTPLAKHLTRWVLDAAIKQAAQWHQQGMPLRISANVMACNFEERGFAERIVKQLEKRGMPAHGFEIELTESAIMSNRRAVRKQLQTLSNAGIRLAIDDFGTGYSSLAYLMSMPADVIKIDRVFTSTTREELKQPQETLLKALIELAHGMGYETVAEGFEPPSMQELLCGLGCDEGQSFAISMPLTPAGFQSWYDHSSRSLNS